MQVTGLKSVTGHTLPQPVENAVLHRPLHRLEGANVWGTIGVKFEQKAGGEGLRLGTKHQGTCPNLRNSFSAASLIPRPAVQP